ncbi:MAG: outer membrane beta-barrel protein [Bacteroidales bacterium]|nr:outer membrane beta-barrel protein [Bacteroidales bacterium]
MRKSVIPLLLLFLLILPVNAQFTKIGGGAAAGTGIYYNNETDQTSYKTGLPALFVTGIYEFTLPVHIAPSYTFYIPHITRLAVINESSARQIISCMMFDIDGHYVFNSLDRIEFYGLTGLNINLISSKRITEISGTKIKSKESDNAFGLNLGAGAYLKLSNQFDLVCEAKYIVSRYDQFLFRAGILINLDWLIKHENTGL